MARDRCLTITTAAGSGSIRIRGKRPNKRTLQALADVFGAARRALEVEDQKRRRAEYLREVGRLEEGDRAL